MSNALNYVFLDRDGTIIVDPGYLHDPDKIEFLPGAVQAIKKIHEKGYQLVLFTNQSGIGRKIYQVEDMHRVHERLDELLIEYSAPPFGKLNILFCPHHPEAGCSCRKPKIELIDQYLSNKTIDRANSYMVGDKEIDRQTGVNAGINGVLLIDKPKEGEFRTLLEFAIWLKDMTK